MFWSNGIIYIVRIIFIANALYLALSGEFLKVGVLLGSLVLTFIPEIFTKLTHVKITSGGKVTYVVFILGTQWLGTYLRLYDSLIWWDIMLHFSSGILLGYVGIVLLVWIDKERMLKGQIGNRVIMLFSFLVSIAGAVFWEIAEFLSDTFIGSNTQLGSLRDTMEDMIFGTIGAALFVLYLYFTCTKKKNSCLRRLVNLNKVYKKDE